MGKKKTILSQEQKAVYEKMPLPFCVLHAYADTYEVAAVSDGFCNLMNKERKELMDPSMGILQYVASDDRKAVVSALEYARVQSGTIGHISFHFNKDILHLKAYCCCIAERLLDQSFLIYLSVSGNTAKDETAKNSNDFLITNDAHELMPDNDENKIAEWEVDLEENRTISYRKHSVRGMNLNVNLSYDKMVLWMADHLHLEEDQNKYRSLLNRKYLKQKYKEGYTSFTMQYRRDEEGAMPFWVSLIAQTYISERGLNYKKIK